MSSTNSPRSVKENPKPYETFIGLETMRDTTAQDTGSRQALYRLAHGHIDALGQIVKDPGLDRIQSAVNVMATKHLNIYDLTWLESDYKGFTAKSSSGRSADFGWNKNAIPNISAFNGNLYYMASGQPIWRYTGAAFQVMPPNNPLVTRLRPAFGITIQERFVIGGLDLAPGTIEVSRVNDLNYFEAEEADDEEAVTRGGKIDVWSVLGERETLTGLAEFETNKLVIFTGKRGIIYRISTNIDDWELEDRTSLANGCISHRSIQQAGPAVLYCSRNGVYAISRQIENGSQIGSKLLSAGIGLLYRTLLRTVPDPRLINAVWDQDENQYHIFFPQSKKLSYRLTMTVDDADFSRSPRWSLSEGPFMPLCGDFHEGSLVLGASEGLYQVGKIEEDNHEINPDLIFETPVLHLGSFTEDKQINSIIISASGNAQLTIEVIDVASNRIAWTKVVEVEPDAVPDEFFGFPLSSKRRIPMNMRTTSVRVRFTAKGAGLFRFAGFAFVIAAGS